MVNIGVYGRFSPPLDDAIKFSTECENIGLDLVAFTDQIAGNLPDEVWHETAAGKFLPRQHNYLDAATVVALSAAATSRIELYLGAIDVVRNVPSRLAQMFVTLSHAAKGRAWFALGASEIKNVTEFGHSRIGSADKLEDSFAIIRKLFDSAGEQVFHQGKQYHMKGGRFGLEPYDGKWPQILAATGGSPEFLARIGANADGLMTNLPGMCHGGVEQFAKDRQIVRDAAERAGRDPDSLRFAASILAVMHDDPDVRKRLANTVALQWDTIVYGAVNGKEWRNFGYEHPLGDEWAYARHLRPEKITAAEVREASAKVPPGAVLDMGHWGGTAEEVAEKVRPYVEAGLHDVVLVDYAPYADPSLAPVSSDNLERFTKALKGTELGSSALGWLGVGQET